LQRNLDLEWKTACLHADEKTEAAQVVTVNIKAIDGIPIKTPSGFTISFKQQTSPPSLLRLESVPNPSASNKDVAESWREPPQSLRLSLSNTSEPIRKESEPQSLEDHVRELKALEAELQEIQLLIVEKKKQIHAQVRKDVKNFSKELSRCDGISCIFKTIAHKAHGAWTTVYLRFDSNHHHPHSKEMGRPEQAFAQAHGHTAQVSGGRLNIEQLTPQPYEAPTVSHFFSNTPPTPLKQN
jgi:hypothetical protein